MNYYPFHVGDYTAHTAHLEPLEDLAYRRMLDAYYLREEPMPADPKDVARLIRMRGNLDEVETVLREYFTLCEDGWRQGRCDAEIVRMQDKQAKARASAAASVEARRAKAGNERSTDAERTLNGRSTDVELPTPTPTPEEKQKPSGAEPPELFEPDGETCDPPADPPPIRQRGCTFATFVDECRTKGEKPIPEDHPVFRFADDAGIPVEFVRLAWMEFRRDFGDGGKGAKKRQAGVRGWRQHFDNAVRKGWYRLWAFDRQGECYLTPAGIALQRESEARDAA